MTNDSTRGAQVEFQVPVLCKCGCGGVVPPPKFPSWQRQYISGHQPAANRPLEQRFWEKMDKRGDDECWEWQASIDKRGYGQLKNPLARNNIRAHRLAWMLVNGDIPDGLWVLHKCDNRKCCNPNHLFLGTCKDNHDDMRQKGRHPHGDTHPMTKLSDEQVAEVRRRHAEGGISQQELAKEYGISAKHICEIINGRKRAS